MSYEHQRGHRKLDRRELADAMRIIAATSPGRYRLRDLYGDEWLGIRSPQDHGRSFSESLRAGASPGVRWVKKRSDKAHEYEVLPIGPQPVVRIDD